jgi:polyhydroxyalkanoate synthesis regulator phasin
MTTTDRLKAMLDQRHERGLAKYKVTVDRTDLTPSQWAQQAIEEMLDGAAYLMRLQDNMDSLARRVLELERENEDLREQLETKGDQ